MRLSLRGEGPHQLPQSDHFGARIDSTGPCGSWEIDDALPHLRGFRKTHQIFEVFNTIGAKRTFIR